MGDRLADSVVSRLGSWGFVLAQSAVVALWLLTGGFGHDIFPFILLNLLFSTQAAYASPLILMAANRASRTDRARDACEALEVTELLNLQRTQLDLLHEVRTTSRALHEHIVVTAALPADRSSPRSTPLIGADQQQCPPQHGLRQDKRAGPDNPQAPGGDAEKDGHDHHHGDGTRHQGCNHTHHKHEHLLAPSEERSGPEPEPPAVRYGGYTFGEPAA